MNPLPALLALAAATTTAPAAELMVSAAASLASPLSRIERDFEAANPDIDVVLNTASSGTLARQIENGAPVDVFIPAAAAHMDALEATGLVDKTTRRNIATNSIVLVTPASSKPKHGFDFLGTARVVMIGDPAAVPAGMYAMQVLAHLGIATTIAPALVHGRNVRHVAASVAAGHADAGFVYATDAARNKELRIAAPAPDGSHEPVVYPAAAATNAPNRAAAARFIDFLGSQAAQSTFEKAGFGHPVQ